MLIKQLRFDRICFFSVNGWNFKDRFIAVNNIMQYIFFKAINSLFSLLRFIKVY